MFNFNIDWDALRNLGNIFGGGGLGNLVENIPGDVVGPISEGPGGYGPGSGVSISSRHNTPTPSPPQTPTTVQQKGQAPAPAPASAQQTGDWDLSQAGPMEAFFNQVLPLMGMKGFGQRQFEGPGRDFFNQPLFGAEYTKGLIPQMAGPRAGGDAVSAAVEGLSGTGAATDYWNQVQGALGGPMGGEQYLSGALPGVTEAGLGQQYAGSVVPGMMGQTGGQNLAAQQLQRLQGQMPDLQGGPGLDPYYENAKRRAQEDIRAQTAALGAYGSAAGQEMGAEAMTNLAAEQANREAQYRMQQLQEQRQWEGLAGQMAGQASAEQRGWTGLLGDLAMGAEGMDIQRQGLGADMARVMDTLQQGRIGLGGEIAGQAGAQDIARKTARGQLGLGQGQLDLAGLMGAAAAGRGVDQDTLNQVVSGIQSGLGVDASNLNKLFGFGGMAGAAQGARQQRIPLGYDMTSGMGNYLTNLAMNTYGGMGAQDQDLFTTIQNMILGNTGAGAQGGRFMTDQGWNTLNTMFPIAKDQGWM